MPVRLVSRASDLAVLQAGLVARALRQRWPRLEIETLTRSSLGDRDNRIGLWDAADKGVFTADLSEALANGHAEIAVHSWKDLPVESVTGTMVAATLERADPRDVLLVRRPSIAARPLRLSVLTSSPRRTWQLERSLAPLLPWPVEAVDSRPIRGNIPTRLRKLVGGEGDALVVAKAALDRLLSEDATSDVRRAVRQALDGCAWSVLPLREFPTAAAQGALAIEVAASRADVIEVVRGISHETTRVAVEAERAILASHGGGCREAIGASVLIRDYGVVTSVRGRLSGGLAHEQWSLDANTTPPPRTSPDAIWPRPEERRLSTRRPLGAALPADAGGLFVTRADALPDESAPRESQIVWAAGTATWARLAARGIWVHGCTDGLGDAEAPSIDLLAGHPVTWLRLTHTGSDAPNSLATYVVDHVVPDDVASRTHFFWTSGSFFLEMLGRFPGLRQGWHASGPGRTFKVVQETLGAGPRVSIWLDHDHWYRSVTL